MSNVVALPVIKRESPSLPDDFAMLTSTHALLVALDLYGDRDLAYGVMALSGFSDMSFVMTWRNAAHRDGLIDADMTEGVSEAGRDVFLVWHLSARGRAKLAVMNITRKRRKPKTGQPNEQQPDLGLF